MLGRIKRAACAVGRGLRRAALAVKDWIVRNKDDLIFVAIFAGWTLVYGGCAVLCFMAGGAWAVLGGLFIFWMVSAWIRMYSFYADFKDTQSYSYSRTSSDYGYRIRDDFFTGFGRSSGNNEETESDPRKVRINNLRAKAKSTTFPAEAEAFNAKADQLEKRYGLV